MTEPGPERIGDVLGRLFALRGWGRRQETLRLEEAWNEAIGPAGAAEARVGAFRRGVLEIHVANHVLLQELAQYQKRALLEKLRGRLPGLKVTDIRFRLKNMSSQ